MRLLFHTLLITIYFPVIFCLLPPRFQWKMLDYAWEAGAREAAIKSGDFIPKNNLPYGIARWKDKLFITVPRWKTGVPASLNYINVNGNQSQSLNPYPSWKDAFVSEKSRGVGSNSTVVSAFRVHVDRCDRLWVVDNGVSDMLNNVHQISPPAILIFDLNTNTLLHRHVLADNVLKDCSVLHSISVDVAGKNCACNATAYITDMGSNALIVYSLKSDEAWRLENHFFHFDPHSGVYKVGGVDFYWSDGVSSAVLLPSKKCNSFPDLHFHPTSSTKQFRISTKLLRNKETPADKIFSGVMIVGDRGPNSQATANAYDEVNNVFYYTQLSKNGISCWNVDKPMTPENVPLIVSDCTVLEFPNDITVDKDGFLWILSNRQARFLYDSMDFDQVNFRILNAPSATVVQGTSCEKWTNKVLSFITGS